MPVLRAELYGECPKGRRRGVLSPSGRTHRTTGPVLPDRGCSCLGLNRRIILRSMDPCLRGRGGEEPPLCGGIDHHCPTFKSAQRLPSRRPQMVMVAETGRPFDSLVNQVESTSVE